MSIKETVLNSFIQPQTALPFPGIQDDSIPQAEISKIRVGEHVQKVLPGNNGVTTRSQLRKCPIPQETVDKVRELFEKCTQDQLTPEAGNLILRILQGRCGHGKSQINLQEAELLNSCLKEEVIDVNSEHFRTGIVKWTHATAQTYSDCRQISSDIKSSGQASFAHSRPVPEKWDFHFEPTLASQGMHSPVDSTPSGEMDSNSSKKLKIPADEQARKVLSTSNRMITRSQSGMVFFPSEQVDKLKSLVAEARKKGEFKYCKTEAKQLIEAIGRRGEWFKSEEIELINSCFKDMSNASGVDSPGQKKAKSQRSAPERKRPLPNPTLQFAAFPSDGTQKGGEEQYSFTSQIQTTKHSFNGPNSSWEEDPTASRLKRRRISLDEECPLPDHEQWVTLNPHDFLNSAQFSYVKTSEQDASAYSKPMSEELTFHSESTPVCQEMPSSVDSILSGKMDSNTNSIDESLGPWPSLDSGSLDFLQLTESEDAYWP